MTAEEKRIEVIKLDLMKMPKGIVYYLCAALIASNEPEKFKWDDLKNELCNKENYNANVHK